MSLLHSREFCRDEERIGDVGDDGAVLLRLGALGDPFRVSLERIPLLLAVAHRLPVLHISELLVRFSDRGDPDAGLADAVALPQIERDRLEALQQRRHAVRHRAIDAHLIDHVSSPFSACCGRREVRAGSDHTNRLRSIAAPIKDANSGCGSNGRDLSSGWNCTPMNQGWSSYSTISGRMPSGDMPEKRMPRCSRRSL